MTESYSCDDELYVSMCTQCARHSGIKSLIEEKSANGLCAFCGLDGVIRDPADDRPLIMLIRALIRYHYHEHEFNSHWGGDCVLSLFEREDNPIVTPPVTSEYLDTFYELIQHDAYPAWDEGVAIYAGSDSEGVRGLNFAISTTSHFSLKDISRRLLVENFADVEPSLASLFDPFVSEIAIDLPVGRGWFRARLGQKARYADFSGWETAVRYEPWQREDIGAPPASLAGNGRLNRMGVSVLYLASNISTAVAEIRPHPGHTVSVAEFANGQIVRIADFDQPIERFASNDKRLNFYHIISTLDRYMSLPITPEDKRSYLLTQLLADYLNRKGFDGVRFKSSVSEGQNICIFNPQNFSFIEGSSKVTKITNLIYQVDEVPVIHDPEEEDMFHKIG